MAPTVCIRATWFLSDCTNIYIACRRRLLFLGADRSSIQSQHRDTANSHFFGRPITSYYPRTSLQLIPPDPLQCLNTEFSFIKSRGTSTAVAITAHLLRRRPPRLPLRPPGHDVYTTLVSLRRP